MNESARQDEKKTALQPRLLLRRLELVFIIAACLAFAYFYSSCSKPVNNAEILEMETPPKTTEISAIPVIDPNADFSRFQHANPTHARFPCALCHERKDNSATPKLTGHMPCAGCHTAQFADNKNAICTICHKDAEAGTVKAFPALASFNVVFDHARHIKQTNCATCHRPGARNGAALSIPGGLNAHNTCFGCHSPGAKSGEKEIDSCSTCHRPGRFGGSVPELAAAFVKTPFSHARHRFDCSACHNIKPGAPWGNQVTGLTAKMHLARGNAQSCATCHNNKRAFGGDDFSDCRRCHTGSTYKFS